MSDRLPPLTALRAFEAAARHMSFQNAAAELNVTPAALSFQIKSLEDHLGAPVFRRLNRAVELTEAGRVLQPGTQDGFDLLNAAWRAARRLDSGRSLTVTAGPAFTTEWLAPRMFAFAQAHPQVELRIAASLARMEFDRDEIDVAIRFGYGPDPGLYVQPLLTEWLTPVATPELAAKINSPADLLHLPLLQDDSIDFVRPPLGWGAWFSAVGVDATPTIATRFSNADHAINAATVGSGVLLARGTLAAGALLDGRLVAPFKTALSTTAMFRILCPQGHQDRAGTRAFINWLIAEVAPAQTLAEAFDMVSP